ncbi:MAG: hemerythrin family protein [Candidatus Adiutrix sp.]|jgi:hemerythrin|nr:hemerythrin family protein [Candidatus Adiutrix sp.]
MGLEWNAKLETGVERIDNQHRELYRLVNLVLDSDQGTKIDDTFKFLDAYVVQHFADEEALQVASRYPGLPEHKEMHTDFIRALIDLKSQLAKTASDKEQRELVVLAVNGTVVDWLGNHINIHDRHFAEWYKTHMES